MIDVVFGEEKIFYQEQALPERGYVGLAVDKRPIIDNPALTEELVEWFKCREQYHRKATETKQDNIYFAHGPGEEISIACFISKIEKILSFNFSIQRSLFSRTNMENILWTSPSSFWKECNVKFNLYTIFLRAGLNYNYEKDNFDEALYSMPIVDGKALFPEGVWSINRFLYGFTKFIPVDENERRMDVGWINLFKTKNKDQIRQQLISPIDRQTYSIGGTTLWT
jgi:hypothetical protein